MTQDTEQSEKRTYLDAAEIAQVAHEAVYRAWFRLSGSREMVPWDGVPDGAKRDAKDAVSSQMRRQYQNARIPISVPPEYGEFWKVIVNAAIGLSYAEASSNDD